MSASQLPGLSAESPCASAFALYVEGPRDREILRAWAWRVSPLLADRLMEGAVILGGRKPERAAEHFRSLRVQAGEAVRGLCVLDRDHLPPAAATHAPVAGLELFTWPRRHIESYLLVPDAILRSVDLSPRDPRLRRLVAALLPDDEDESALREVNAKALLGASGPLSRALGRPLSPGRLAREMDRGELHADVLGLLAHVARVLGLVERNLSTRAV
ncbi:MAG TPA: hypothetical protein VMW35_13705 [Myxococcota bacterium]|nr:hypothetical protein [Myxococcota bacterium]